jgi:hypothetical protein
MRQFSLGVDDFNYCGDVGSLLLDKCLWESYSATSGVRMRSVADMANGNLRKSKDGMLMMVLPRRSTALLDFAIKVLNAREGQDLFG